MIKVVIAGFLGKMGQAALNMVQNEAEFELVGLIDPFAKDKELQGVPVYNDKSALLDVSADVWIDFTVPEVAYENTKFALENGFSPVVGTTGFTQEVIIELKQIAKSKKLGGLIAPNFAIGAVLMMQFAKKAAEYLPDVEIIELHHDQKVDAPSGTALKTAEMIAEVRQKKLQGAVNEIELIDGARGANYDGLRIHSVRLPGLVAHQEVLFGAKGEGLTIRHDSYDRSSFMSGVNHAIKQVVLLDGLVYGLENLL
ncbi:MAG: 4-hydroxy-tetrahydrodipicolinate reductase [Streptococcaceae bacterium]|jgi:4-hydroxy-tetrahydrodipicolinate reductase|nr:4-hydroxy-tetrahydrodipicolinate reductase [Streptococcaceae bacterium]